MNAFGGSSLSHGGTSFGVELRDTNEAPPFGIIQPGALSFRQREELVAAQQQYRQQTDDSMQALGISNRPQIPQQQQQQQQRGGGWAPAGQPPQQMPLDSLYGNNVRSNARAGGADAAGGSYRRQPPPPQQQQQAQDGYNPFVRQMHPERPTVEQLSKFQEQSAVEDAFMTASFVANRLCPWCGQFCAEAHIAQCDRRLVCCPVCDDLVFAKDAFHHLQKCQDSIIRLATERVEKRLKQIKLDREEQLERERVTLLIQQAEADAAALRERANARVTTKQGLGSLLFSGISEGDVLHNSGDAPALASPAALPSGLARRQSVVQLGGGDDPFSPSAAAVGASPRRQSSIAFGPDVVDATSGGGGGGTSAPSFRVPLSRQASMASPATLPMRTQSNVRPRGSDDDADQPAPPQALQPAPSFANLQYASSFSAGGPVRTAAAGGGGGSGSDEPLPPGFKRCKWCATAAPPEHEKKCASRIVMCKKCGSMIKMREKDAHVKMCTAVNGAGGGGSNAAGDVA